MLLPPDRRSTVKARHRRAILDAALTLIARQSAQRFSVDDLAGEAGVSRRTIFNHFASIDDVVITVCVERLADVLDNVRATAMDGSQPGGRAGMFEDIARAIRATDVPSVMAFLDAAFGGLGSDDARLRQIGDAAFSRISEQLTTELVDRDPTVDALEAEILVASLMHGTGVIAAHWVAETGAATDDRSRAIWSQLLERLLATVRAGYIPTPPTTATEEDHG